MRKGMHLMALSSLMVWSVGVLADWPVSRDVDQDAVWFAHADLQALRTTTLGEYLLRQLDDEKAQDKLEAFRAIFNFDPGADLDSLTLYGYGGEKNGVVIARGRFDPDRLETLVKGNDSHQSQAYGTYTVHSWIDKKKAGDEQRTFGSVHSRGTVVFADSMVHMEGALNILDGRQDAMTVRSRFPGLQGVDAYAIFVAAADMKAVADADPAAQAFRAADSAALSLGETGGVMNGTVVLEVPNSETAVNLKKVIDGLLALAQLNQGQDPAAAQVAQSARVETQDQRIRMTLSVPVADLIQKMESSR